jgi:beta-ketoacyl-acyl-carrier-protein synthase II
MGTVNPLGLTVEESWKNAVNGVSGVGPVTLADTKDLQVHIAAEVKNFNPDLYMSPKEARRRDRFEQFAVAAASQAIDQSRLSMCDIDKERVGVLISCAIGGLRSLQESFETMFNEGPRRISPFSIPMFMGNGGAGIVSIDNGYHGPSMSITSACASSSDAIGLSLMMLRTGMIDYAIAGGAESTISMLGITAFDRVGALSRKTETDRNGQYCTPSPFDKNRDGLVMGEGGAVIVLEREASAHARGAEILAEIIGYGASADAYHVTAPIESGSGGAQAIRTALKFAGISPADIDYINAHGTATPLNDVSETRAIKAAFGKQAYNVPISSTKSMTGHMMGATAALEAIFCVQIVRTGLLPPTINYSVRDPECDLDYIPNRSRSKSVDIALSNAFGFGGHNSVLVIKRYN